jgi:DNA-binding LacI/PurR family transcriptional regulator
VARSPDHPSLASLARALGVSTATVSNVYNRPERVSEELRARVLAQAQKVGYAGPDPAARQLRRGRSDVLGLIFTDELSFAFNDQASVGFLAGVADACAGSGRNLLLMPAGPPRGRAPISAVDAASVDGVIVYSVPDDDPHLRAVLRRGLPTVVVDQPSAVAGADWVGLDDRTAARELALHLADLGHRRIGVITSRLGDSRYNGPVPETRWRAARYAVQRERLHGLCDGFADFGIAAHALPVEERFEASHAAGAGALDALLDRHPGLTAVCCLADVLALGALDAARRRGLDVPGRLSITGFDDIAEASRARLTTVHQPLADKGRVAGEFLLRRLDHRPGSAHQAAGSHQAERRTLPTSLEVRSSTGPASTPHP